MEKKTPTQEPLTEEEFLELVLAEQEKALAEERRLRQLRAQGQLPPPRKRRSLRLIMWTMAIVLLLNAGALLLQVYSIPAIEFVKVSAILSQDKTVQAHKESVVEIRTTDSKGTGFSVTDDGWIITNAHVVDDALSIAVSFPEHGVYEASVIATYPDIDTAFLKVEAKQLPFVTLGQAITYVEHEAITFIGNPLAFSGIANEGEIVGPLQLAQWPVEVIQIDAPVYKGNSGSPVFNEDGDVIGVVFATIEHEELSKVGLFVPIDTISHYMPKALKKELDDM